MYQPKYSKTNFRNPKNTTIPHNNPNLRDSDQRKRESSLRQHAAWASAAWVSCGLGSSGLGRVLLGLTHDLGSRGLGWSTAWAHMRPRLARGLGPCTARARARPGLPWLGFSFRFFSVFLGSSLMSS